MRNLLNAVGLTLKPSITAVLHPANSGAGLPDGGLFSSKDLTQRGADSPALFDLKPERGVIEVKGLAQNIAGLEQTPQVLRYLEHYGQILITNYRSFALFSWENGKPRAGERFVLAETEADFWSKVYALQQNPGHPNHERLWQFIRRALLSTARIATPQDLAAFLASYAREARARVEIAPLRTLDPVKQALSDSLGVRFDGEKGLHFFQSTLVQTLFYGIFSAWVLWHEGSQVPGGRFHWKNAVDHLGLPILRSLFHQVAYPANIRALDLEEVLDWTNDCLARVDHVSFFARYDMGEAVQYFYEPFLAEFDPALRKEFGVWYTPPEIVRYMVGSIDAALRKDFNLRDGLADPQVVVLDPCCGTGAYLVETLKLIHRRFVDAYGEGQAALKIRDVATRRLFGFELLPAPYVVAHLQIDLLLTRWGATLDHEKDERAGIFLTNALTGWVPVKHPKDLPFSEFAAERDAADQVKQKEQILVILGNPPYDGFAGITKIEEERALSEAYKTTKLAPPPTGQGLNELYVRFFRMAERRIAEGVPSSDDPRPATADPHASGIICFISNYSWLDGDSHSGMRERFMEVFDSISIDCLNGDSRETGKRTPDGLPDPSVFSTARNREGIQVGTAIALMERRPAKADKRKSKTSDASLYTPRAAVRSRQWWGNNKRAELLSSLEKHYEWEDLNPSLKFGLKLVPLSVNASYNEWPQITELFPWRSPGIKRSQMQMTHVDLPVLQSKMGNYFDNTKTWKEVARITPSLCESTKGFNAEGVRRELLEKGMESGRFMRFYYRPLEVRWLYWHGETKLLDRRRDDLVKMAVAGNCFLISRPKAERTREGSPCVVAPIVGDRHLTRPGAMFFPLFAVEGSEPTDESQPGLFDVDGPIRKPNLSPLAESYLRNLGLKLGVERSEESELLFFHTIAVCHSPRYLKENAGGLSQGWPRIPLPKSSKVLRVGAALGRNIALLLDPTCSVHGVTDLQLRPDLRGLGN